MKTPRRLGLAVLLLIAAVLATFASPAAATMNKLHGAGRVVMVAGSYPAGVVAHDAAAGDSTLHQVYDLRTANPGPRTALTPVASYSAPAGSAYSAGALAFTASSGSPAVNGVDFSGRGVYVTGNSTVARFTDVKFGANPLCCYSLEIGATVGGVSAGSPTVAVSYCLADMAGASDAHSPAIQLSNASIVSFDHCTFQNAPRDPIVMGVGQTLNCAWCYFKAFGQATVNGDHLEFIHPLGGGALNLSYCFMNYVDGVDSQGGVSGAIQAQTDLGPAPVRLDHCIIFGAKTFVSHGVDGAPSVGVPGSLSCKAVTVDQTYTVTDSVLQAGPSGKYTVVTEQNGHKCHFVDGGRNFDYDTGAPIVISLADRPPLAANDNAHPALALAA